MLVNKWTAELNTTCKWFSSLIKEMARTLCNHLWLNVSIRRSIITSKCSRRELKRLWKSKLGELFLVIYKRDAFRLRLVPSKLEQKASMPSVQMQIVVDEGHHKLGAEVSAADIGMPLALKWSMVPESGWFMISIKVFRNFVL